MNTILVLIVLSQIPGNALSDSTFEGHITSRQLQALESRNMGLELQIEANKTELEMMRLENQRVTLSAAGENRSTVLLLPEAAEPASALRSAVWLIHEIEVAWENPNVDNGEERRWVQDAVGRTWGAVSGIRFTGWGQASEGSGGIRIRIEDAHPHCKNLGRYLDGLKDGMVLNFDFGGWCQVCALDRKGSIEKIAVHEFGHALGFAHEHNRPDTPEWCRTEHKPQGRDGDYQLTVYDPQSIMNYCSNDWNNGGVLSPLDVKGVEILYGKPATP